MNSTEVFLSTFFLALRDASSVMSEIGPRWSRVADFSSPTFPKPGGSPIVMKARDLIH